MEANKKTHLNADTLRSKRIEFMMKNLDYSNEILVETKNSLLDFGHYILGELSDEFDDNTDHAIKFENDYDVAVNYQPKTTRLYFKDSEIERLTDIKNLIIKCFGNKRVYRMLNQYISMCNYLEFLHQPEPVKVAGKNNFDTNDTVNPLIFDKTLLMNLHREFNDSSLLLPIDFESFKNCFREKPQKIQFQKGITVSAICYIFGLIEFKCIGTTDFSIWMKNHVGNNPYRTKKVEFEKYNEDANIEKSARAKRYNNSLSTKQKKAIDLKQNIDNRIKLVLEKCD